MHKHLILIIEDDFIMRKFLHNYLTDTYEVVAKMDALEAFTWIEEGNIPHLIICDINMPEISGYDVIKYVRSSEWFKDIPIVVVSAKKESIARIQALYLGADDYITKPFNPRELGQRIENILKRHKNF